MKNKPIKHPSDMVLKKTLKEELSLKTNHRSSVTTDATEIEHINLKTSHSSTGEDKGVIEDTVVLENEMPLIPVIRVSGEMIDTGRGSYNEHKIGVKTAMPVEYTSIQPPAATVAVKKVGGHIDEKPYSLQVAADCIMEERPECLSINAPTKPYPSSSARVLSFRGPCTKLIEDTRVLPSCSEMPAGNAEPAETHPSGLTHLNISKKTPGSIVKPLLKASSKGFKQLFKFGRNTVKHNVESERLNIKVSAVDNHVGSTASSNAGKKFERRGVKRATRPNPLYIA
ncbi:hypothetical protein IFM89_018043 [Coptis chinensis]|uniref:Uncharacterized protein n=1 Tax=Coptis chinensis TaxID=261450 RepID=A0A835HTJ9_9MAGN|nr:hypothetical protein IFM89_018043 [Coptis chinensis]